MVTAGARVAEAGARVGAAGVAGATVGAADGATLGPRDGCGLLPPGPGVHAAMSITKISRKRISQTIGSGVNGLWSESIMNEQITVACRRDGAGWACDVAVTEGRSETRHEVTISPAEATRYGMPDADATPDADAEAFVQEAFRFLLEREPKELILRRFALGDIERYFPEFGRRHRRS
jgi:hypothetical protein